MNKALAGICVFLVIRSGFLWVKVTSLENHVQELQKPSLYQTMTTKQDVPLITKIKHCSTSIFMSLRKQLKRLFSQIWFITISRLGS